MADTGPTDEMPILVPQRAALSPFELLITCNPPVLESLLAQIPTETILRLYHTSSFLRQFFQNSPTSWRYISWRLYQPAATTATITTNGTGTGPRQSSNYALDQLLIYVINPFSTRLASLELDNTAVSGGTLTQTVLVLRRHTLQHISVRGCKNVSLKYHINPWLQMHALARERPGPAPPGYETLALKSLYAYRCRHHRRRPYLPSSLVRKESDSEPTHELVQTCHKLGIWTDTAWCTTPGARCYRRRGYVTMRVPQDPREVWVVYDRLWRSRNWLGPVDESSASQGPANRKRKRDCRSWEFDEEAVNGEAMGITGEGKAVPAHLRQSHQQFVENVVCHNCSDPILERCEQCSVMMHCSGCRKTLCASCAFDRPYLRNKNAPEEERNKFWWAPGCAVSPCSMQDQDFPPVGAAPNANQTTTANVLPNIKFKWCCTEPVFSGGGGITFGNSSSRETDRIRAVPLPPGHGWEDAEFHPEHQDRDSHPESTGLDLGLTTARHPLTGPGGRWSSIDNLFRSHESFVDSAPSPVPIPRILCAECYSSERWKVKCKACSVSLCLKHDVRDRLKVRICGYKDLALEKQEYKSRQKAIKLLASWMRQRKERQALHQADLRATQDDATSSATAPSLPSPSTARVRGGHVAGLTARVSSADDPDPAGAEVSPTAAEVSNALDTLRTPDIDADVPLRPVSPGSNTTGPPSRSSSPTPSTHSLSATPEPSNAPRRSARLQTPIPKWRGCQSFFCPAARSPGDHRRRCVAIMRQCAECKIHVCGDCITSLEPPCLCKGCRPPPVEDELSAQPSPDITLFFCPNCRWDRMQTGKCKKSFEAALASQSAKKGKKRKEKFKKPVDERRARGGRTTSQDEAINGLVEFFATLNVAVHDHGAMLIPDQDPASQNNIQELEDMGVLARDLMRRIQRLREQFRPGSVEAMALPDIRLEDEDLGIDTTTPEQDRVADGEVEDEALEQPEAQVQDSSTEGNGS